MNGRGGSGQANGVNSFLKQTLPYVIKGRWKPKKSGCTGKLGPTGQCNCPGSVKQGAGLRLVARPNAEFNLDLIIKNLVIKKEPDFQIKE
jgi:hypothetical protein